MPDIGQGTISNKIPFPIFFLKEKCCKVGRISRVGVIYEKSFSIWDDG